MAIAIVSLNSLVAAVQGTYARCNRLLAGLPRENEESGSGRAAHPVPIALEELQLRFCCFAVTDPKDRRGTARGLALSLGPPSLWRRLLWKAEAYELLIAVKAGRASIHFRHPQAGQGSAAYRRPRLNWVLLLSAEQKSLFLELAKASAQPIPAGFRPRWQGLIQTALKFCRSLLPFRTSQQEGAGPI